MRKFLNRERKGASTFEWTLTLPFALMIVFVTIFTMLMLFSWASYGALASNLAKDLNFKVTGMRTMDEWGATNMSSGYIMAGKTSYDGATHTISLDQIRINGNANNGNDALRRYRYATAYHMKEYKDQFFFPYTNFDYVDVYVRRLSGTGAAVTVNPSETDNLSNYIVKVDIHYTFSPVKIMQYGQMRGVNLTASGYGIIS